MKNQHDLIYTFKAYLLVMLINFTCSNFRSFRDEQTLSLLPGKTLNHQGHLVTAGKVNILNTAAIFGANASGKSNIYKAMRFSRDFVLGAKIDRQSYFRLDPKYESVPSTFEYEIGTGGEFFRYGFQVIISTGEITGEWLFRVSDSENKEDTVIFQRPLENNPHPEILSRFKRRSSRYLILTLSDELRKRTSNDVADILKVRDWFADNLKIISTEENLLSELTYSEEQCRALGDLLGDFDLGVFSVGFSYANIREEVGLPKTFRKGINIYDRCVINRDGVGTNRDHKVADAKEQTCILQNNHGSDTEKFLWYDESDGTRRIMDLAPMIISDVPDITYVVDELDRSLHPMVVYEFVRRFANRADGIIKQLIFTTHQTCLLDQNLLRRDEIWFVQKDRSGTTALYSLDDFKERFDKNIERLYLGGRYEGIPNINRRDFDA